MFNVKTLSFFSSGETVSFPLFLHFLSFFFSRFSIPFISGGELGQIRTGAEEHVRERNIP